MRVEGRGHRVLKTAATEDCVTHQSTPPGIEAETKLLQVVARRVELLMKLREGPLTPSSFIPLGQPPDSEESTPLQ